MSSDAKGLVAGAKNAGQGINNVAREVGVGTGTVQRIAREMGGPFDAAAATAHK